MGHAIGDWDNDGRLDWFSSAKFYNRTDCSVVGCVFDSGGNRLYRNQGNKKFEDATDKVELTRGLAGQSAEGILILGFKQLQSQRLRHVQLTGKCCSQ